MVKVLLTGGTGFIASHITEQLLAKGHHVVATVRSKEKGQKLLNAHGSFGDQLQIAIVPDIVREDAFDDVVKWPGIEVVMHTASPVTMEFTDPVKDIIEPALNGTLNMLRAVHRDAPQIRRIIITSSIAAMLNVGNPTMTFTEQCWNPASMEQLNYSKGMAYMIAKTHAERAAWDFVRDEKPNFDLVTVNPPLVMGPLLPHLATVDAINMSNASLADLIRGKWKEAIPPAGPVNVWVDVRDVATAHVAAMERPEAGGHRLLTIAGSYTHSELAELMRAGSYPFQDKLPGPEVEGDAGAKGINYNCDETNELLGINWIPLEKTVADFAKSIKGFDL